VVTRQRNPPVARLNRRESRSRRAAEKLLGRTRMIRLAVLAAMLVGCAYQPGSFAYGAGPEAGFAGQRATVGCLDVAIARRADFDSNAVLHYRFGNRCNRPVEVDLLRVAVVGRLDDGSEIQLWPYDPNDEIRPARLPGRIVGGEAIAYPARQPLTQICVDAASIVRLQPAQWLCFGNQDVALLEAP
jgi:hypothetical protein